MSLLWTHPRTALAMISWHSETVYVMENLFERGTANITGLEPNWEYCIAIQVSTTGGESGFSNAIKLPCKVITLFYSFSFIIDFNIIGAHM